MRQIPANFHGKKGRSGRKSTYEELANAEELSRMYFEKHSQEEIEADIRKGKFSIQQRHILNALKGDQRAIEIIARKLFPDKTENKHEGDFTIKIDI